MVLDRDVVVIGQILAGLRAPQKSHERLDVWMSTTFHDFLTIYGR